MYFFLFAFSILGAGIKYIDDAFDEKTFSKKIAIAIAPVLGVLWAYTMLINAVAATILLAILLAVLLKGKIDNYAHLAGLAMIFLIIIVAGVKLMVPVLVFLTIAAVLDEVGNDFIDKKREYLNKGRFLHKFVMAFFDQRWTLKIAILSIALLGVIPLYFFLAMLLFDEAYLMMRWYSQMKQTASVKQSEKPLSYLQKQVFTFLTFNVIFVLFFSIITLA
ncbi:MAG: hypothetical protein FE038_01875 [Thermoplasmata archaeon]|nr:MAG: hypothetical protein FE038_01875 [Thermoplasmata archaeon]